MTLIVYIFYTKPEKKVAYIPEPPCMMYLYRFQKQIEHETREPSFDRDLGRFGMRMLGFWTLQMLGDR
jgi:hypothetical protein